MPRAFKFKAGCDSTTSPLCRIDLTEDEIVVPDPADDDDADLFVREGPVAIMPIVADVSLTEKERSMIEQCRAAIRAKRAAPDAAPARAATAPAIDRRQLREPASQQKKKQRTASSADIERWEQRIEDAIAWQQHNKVAEFWGFARFALKSSKHLQIREVLMSWENPRAPQPQTHLADVQTQFMQECCKDCFNRMAFQDLRLRAARKAPAKA